MSSASLPSSFSIIEGLFQLGNPQETKNNIREYYSKNKEKIGHIADFLQNLSFSPLDSQAIEKFYWFYKVLKYAQNDPNLKEVERIRQLFRDRIESQLDQAPLLLYQACHNTMYSLASQLLENGFDVNMTMPVLQVTALHYACISQNERAVRWLLQNKARVDCKSLSRGETPFHLAASKGDIQIMQELRNKGADLFHFSIPGHSPLHYAATQPIKLALKFLLELNADITARNNDGETALHKAFVEGQIHNARYLLNLGADIFAVDRFKMMALDTYFSIDPRHHAEMKDSIPPLHLPDVHIEELVNLFNNINFTDSSKPGWIDPAKIIDSDIKRADGKPYVVPVSELKERLQKMVYRIKNRVAFKGTPAKEDFSGLESFYTKLESYMKPVLAYALKEAKREKQCPSSNPTPYAQTLIEFALIADTCGTGYMNEVEIQYGMLKSHPDNDIIELPKTVKDKVLDLCEELKKSVVSSLVDKKYANNTHMKSGILKWIDDDAGVPKEKVAQRLYSLDVFQEKLLRDLDPNDYLTKFYERYSPTSILAVLDAAINGKESRYDRELIIDFFKDYMPKDWKKEWYDHIREEVEACQTSEEKAAKLKTYDIDVNHVLLKMGEAINWNRLIEDDRKHLYLERKVVDGKTGKIKRSALLDMLLMLKVIKPIKD